MADGESGVVGTLLPPSDANGEYSTGSPPVAVVDDVDSYEKSVRGINIHSLRTGQGFGPNLVFSAETDDFVLTAVEAQFPTLGRTTMADDQVVVAHIRSAPRGSSWSEVDLQPGAVIMYSPGAVHTGINPAGLRFEFAVLGLNELEAHAEGLGLTFASPRRGEVRALAPVDAARALGRTLSNVVDHAITGMAPTKNHEDDLLYAAVSAMSHDSSRDAVRSARRRLASRRVLYSCIDYADSIGRLPTIADLCMAAHVSERRLRLAFTDIFDMPPSQFFRLWGLNAAHKRLMALDPASASVSQLAIDLGFTHLGRFAGHYQVVFGERPSATLQSCQ